MERSRLRTLFGLGLIAIGIISLTKVLMRPALPPLPPLPALPPLPPLPPIHHMPFLLQFGWLSPPLILLALIVLVICWRRRVAPLS